MVKLNYEGGLTLGGIGFVESDYMIVIAWYLELKYESIDFFGFRSHKTIDDVYSRSVRSYLSIWVSSGYFDIKDSELSTNHTFETPLKTHFLFSRSKFNK